ncbi:hypothetical protein LJK88_40170 [Paenibacillus sp. P26]|nr:hypothetical protein LJK88_40170 [Paenibacillus sp. P26]
MRTRSLKLTFIVLFVFTAGCSDRMDIEDVTIPLLTGYDLDQHDRLLTYTKIPVFSKDAKKKSHEIGVVSRTLRESRQREDEYAPGLFQGRKILVVLLSKRSLQHENWFTLMDVYFRDAKNSITSRIAMYDGPFPRSST